MRYLYYSLLYKINPFCSDFEKKLFRILKFLPKNTAHYKKAFLHISLKKNIEDNNERLEFLGDAILDAIMAGFLYKKYPFKNEGFLTEMKSKIVNRKTLNFIAQKLNIESLLAYDKNLANRKIDFLGNSLEALIGAIFLDKGYQIADQWVVNEIIIPHIFLNEIESVEANIKNKLFQWAQKNNQSLDFELIETDQTKNSSNVFHVGIFINKELFVRDFGYKKKDAELNAAKLAFKKLNLS